MLDMRLSAGSDSVEHIGVLPTGELYIDHEIAGGDGPDCVATEYLAASAVARIKTLLAMGGAMSDAELLERLVGRFKRGSDILEWLHGAGIATEPRTDTALREGREATSPFAAMMRDAASSSRAFAPGSKFYDVDGVPVALEPTHYGKSQVLALDARRRPFPLDSVLRSGVEISPELFDERVGQLLGARISGPAQRHAAADAAAGCGSGISGAAFEDRVWEGREAGVSTQAPSVWPADD